MPADQPAIPAGDGGLVRVRLDLCYDGGAFHGWAAQPGVRTVQGVLEEALARLLRLPIGPATTVAGRTDAGVHARGQVCHVDLPVGSLSAVSGSNRLSPYDTLLRRLATVLPLDVRVRAVTPAPGGFDARFSAQWRRYAYRVGDAPWGVEPLRRHDVVRHRHPLDLEAMNASAADLLGEHDFAAYCRPRVGATTIRTLEELSWQRGESGLAIATVRADAFCHSMVRALVGALLAVGDGRRPVGWPRDVLARGVREGSVTVAPAHGLTLEAVGYPVDAQLAARAAQARAVRGHDG